jgi:hypothetical protein
LHWLFDVQGGSVFAIGAEHFHLGFHIALEAGVANQPMVSNRRSTVVSSP